MPTTDLARPAVDPALFPLDPAVTFLNHGSFGSCPRVVLDHQQELRTRLERQPVQFLVRDLEGMMDCARGALAKLVGARPDDLVLIDNATTGVNCVLRSLQFQPGDELLVTNHEYNACANVLRHAAERDGARVVPVELPFPLSGPGRVESAVLSRVTERTRLLLIDHVTSPTGLVLPVAPIVRSLSERGIDTLVDGAHAPGMIPLDLKALGAAYYTGNCHKWLCAPKGAAFLHVRPDRQQGVRPVVISHGANSPRSDRSRFQIEFGWTGTRDPTAALSLPFVLDFLQQQLPGGWPDLMARNRQLALAARRLLCDALQIDPPAPDEMIGSLASLPLPDSRAPRPSRSPLYLDPWQDELMARRGIEVPIVPWPAHPKRLVRISAQLYNSLPQYQLLAEALMELIREDAAR